MAGVPNEHPQVTLLKTLHDQLQISQWLPEERIVVNQRQQLAQLAEYANKHSPNFRARLSDVGLLPKDLAELNGLQHLPVLTRRALQSAGIGLFCNEVPVEHLPFAEIHTSGSSGEPVVVRRTAINQLYWLAYTLREHLWFERDFNLPLAIIRATAPQAGLVSQNDWGPPVSLFYKSGPAALLPISNDIKVQVEWLHQFNPGYLLTYPTNLSALLDEFQRSHITLPQLQQIRTIGETLSPYIREKASSILGTEVNDTYSSQEVGIIAIQCPQSELYHTMAESLIVEVLNEDGSACKVGETGRIVITDIHNFATPLVRYDIGDYAEVGELCSCGRGLPTLKRILGRQRNMVIHPDGKRHWPLVGFQQYCQIAPIRQYQLIQRSLDQIEVRLVVDVPINENQQAKLTEVICSALGYPFKLHFICFSEQIPPRSNGKFEEFVSEIA